MISRTRNYVRNPDRELIQLGREYARLYEIEKAAYKKKTSLEDLYESQEPLPSDVMRHTVEDLWTFRFPMHDVTEPICADKYLRRNPFYTEREMAGLKDAPVPRDPEVASAQNARAEQIIREWNRWKAECDVLDVRLGCTASRVAALASTSARCDIADKIAALPARTIGGLKVRSMVLKLIYSEERDGRPEDTPEGLNVWAMLCDIEAMHAPAV